MKKLIVFGEVVLGVVAVGATCIVWDCAKAFVGYGLAVARMNGVEDDKLCDAAAKIAKTVYFLGKSTYALELKERSKKD